MDKEQQKQKKWDRSFMESAKIFAEHSNCAAKKVACLLVKNNAVISIGVNGTLPSLENCNEKFIKMTGIWYRKENRTKVSSIGGEDRFRETMVECEDQEEHFKWSKENEVHAEINALGKASKAGISTEGATAYITYSPCNTCALALAACGIKRIVFEHLYDAESEAMLPVKEYGVEIVALE